MELDFNWLARLPLFAGIGISDLPTMLDCLGSYRKHYEKNEIILLESCEVRTVGVILQGTVHMVKEDAEGYKTLLMTMRTGDLFGESFACGSCKSARVSFQAAGPCVILFLPFHRVLHSCKMTCVFHHRLIENMVGLMGDKNIRLLNKIEVISKRTLRDKILTYLRLQAEEQKKQRFTIPLGRLELAEYLCADRSAMTRELSRMKRDGLIDYRRNTFQLL